MANMMELEATLGEIEADPEHWNNAQWFCGTTACFAGITAERHGWRPTGWWKNWLGDDRPLVAAVVKRGRWLQPVRETAIEICDLTEEQAHELFSGCVHTLDDLKRIVKLIANGEL